MKPPSCGSSTLHGPQVTPQKCTMVGRPACAFIRACQLPRSNGLSSVSADCTAAGIRSASKTRRGKEFAFHDSSSIGMKR